MGLSAFNQMRVRETERENRLKEARLQVEETQGNAELSSSSQGLINDSKIIEKEHEEDQEELDIEQEEDQKMKEYLEKKAAHKVMRGRPRKV